MLRLSLLVILLTHSTRTAHVTDTPNVFSRLYQKLDKLNPPSRQHLSPTDRLYEKLDRLNSLVPDRADPSDEEVELLSAMQAWLSAEQMDGVVKDLQRMKAERGDIDQDYGDSDWNDEDEYPMDGGNDDWDSDDVLDPSSTSKPILDFRHGVTPSAITKLEPVRTVVSAAASIAATKARPRIVDDSNMSPAERRQLRNAVFMSTSALVRIGKCLVPQPRWLTVRQLAPAADTVYTPPCVQLHRCAPDSGCCINDGEVCAPVEGKSVMFPFYLHKADGSMHVVRMEFYNHTKCACVSRETLESTYTTRFGTSMNMAVGNPSFNDSPVEDRPVRRTEMDRQNDWRTPTEEPAINEDATAPPQLRRCTCPALFMANMTATTPCTCVCDWPDINRRRDCQSLARGKEHFGLRDRFCVARGDCTAPTCEYGAYDRNGGRCPLKKYRRVRYHSRARYQEKTYTV